MVIPPGTTGIIQPLDRFFFRPWKHFLRQVSDRIMEEPADEQVDFFQRNHLIRMQSLIHHIFRSPRFKAMIQYAFFTTGYLHERPSPFLTPVEYCFNSSFASQTCAMGCKIAQFPCLFVVHEAALFSSLFWLETLLREFCRVTVHHRDGNCR